jgi:predicted GTPase
VGKTSVINALKEGRSAAIALCDRTVSVQVSRQLLKGVDLRIWDFAGEALAVAVEHTV